MPLCLSVSHISQAAKTPSTRFWLGLSVVKPATFTSPRQARAFHPTALTCKFKKMPPKGKKGDEPKRVVLGRPGNNLKVDAAVARCFVKVELTRCRLVSSAFPMSESRPSSTPSLRRIWVKPPTSPMLPCGSSQLAIARATSALTSSAIRKRLVSLCPTPDSTGFAMSTSRSPRFRPS